LAGPAPDVEDRTDPLGTFLHAPEPPVARTLGNLSVLYGQAFAVVPHVEPEVLVAVSDLQFDRGGVGVLERVQQRLPPDLVELLARRRPRRPGSCCRRRSATDARSGREPPAASGERRAGARIPPRDHAPSPARRRCGAGPLRVALPRR